MGEKPGGSAPLAMICSGPIVWVLVIEVDEIAASHVDCADAQAGVARIETIEVDKSFERGPQSAVS